MTIQITGDAHADQVLTDSPFALLVGMMLDQQYPMEHAFRGPAKVLDRFGSIEPSAIAAADPAEFKTLCSTPPAIHRFPGSMAGRVQQLCRVIVEDYDGDAAAVWRDAKDGADLLKRIEALPGFGKQKAKIFLALLGKQLGVKAKGWREAAGEFGAAKSHKSIADITDAKSLEKVRAFKKQMKAEAKAQAAAS
jgi:uncharacterized HhH-GPD family protein